MHGIAFEMVYNFIILIKKKDRTTRNLMVRYSLNFMFF